MLWYVLRVPLGFKTQYVANVMLEEMFIEHVMALTTNKVLIGVSKSHDMICVTLRNACLIVALNGKHTLLLV